MALITTALGLTLLYTSWRSRWRRDRRLVAVLSGWLLVAVMALSCWIEAAGAEFGVPLSLMAPTCIVLILLTCEWLRTGGARAGERKQHAGRDTGPRDGLRHEGDAEADGQSGDREDPEKADRHERADEQPLQDPARRARQPLLVGTEVEREERGQQRKAARIDDGEAAGDECDRDRDGVHVRFFVWEHAAT